MGEGDSAKALRGYFLKSRLVALVEKVPNVTVHVEENHEYDAVVVDGVDGDLEREVINGIAEQTKVRIRLHRDGGIQSPRAIKIGVPVAVAHQVEIGIFNGVMKYVTGPKKRWWHVF